MSASSSLPLGPFEHVSMDYTHLRQEGLRLLGELAGHQWSDFNTHDPGMTILEQLCYALTDLGYRTNYSMPELLAESEDWLPRPEVILPIDPVTAADMQRLAIDVDGVGHAWLESASERGAPVYFHPASGEIRFFAGAAEVDAAPIEIHGFTRVIVQVTEDLTSEKAVELISARLHAVRNLGSDLEVVRARTFPIHLSATIEVGAVEDPVDLMADIIDGLQSYLSPPARFVPFSEARRSGRRLEEIFEGPRLEHGYLSELPPRLRSVSVSDLLRTIVDVSGVRVVRSLALNERTVSADRWVLEVPSGLVPVLASTSELTLVRDNLPLRVERGELTNRLRQRSADRERIAVGDEPAVEPSRPRNLRQFRSIRYQLPAAYGVGPQGLPTSASGERLAQARNLAEYLSIFDRLFANALSQLAHAGDLLSPNDEARTYYSDVIERDPLGDASAEAPKAWLAAVEPAGQSSRRTRFLAHLLARFGEELGDHTQLEGAETEANSRENALIKARSTFLRDYAELGRRRGTAGNTFKPEVSAGSSGFEARLRHKLGIEKDRSLFVIEHVLLRPLPEDQGQIAEEGETQVPLLGEVSEPDPWSLQVSVVIDDEPPLSDGFKQFAAQIIANELPAHLSATLYWLSDIDGEDLNTLEAAWDKFRFAFRDYQIARLDGESVPKLVHLKVRSARDRVIDLLGFGRTYPLRDIPLPSVIHVPSGVNARIPLEYSQPGVTYELRERKSGAAIKGSKPVGGTGEGIELIAPAIDQDIGFRVFAVKEESQPSNRPRRETLLAGIIQVIEGLDASIDAQLKLPVLNPVVDNPKPTDARVGDFGVQAELVILESQVGAQYEIIEHTTTPKDAPQVLSKAAVFGTGGVLLLQTQALNEDIDLRVRARRGDKTIIFNDILPLRVRPDARVSTQVIQSEGQPGLLIESSEARFEYELFVRPILDDEFFLDKNKEVRVRTPEPSAQASLTDLGFVSSGKRGPGTGGSMQLLAGPVTEDVFVAVQLTKRHEVGPLGQGSETLPSQTPLAQPQAVFLPPKSSVVAQVRLPPLNPILATPEPTAARVGHAGVEAEIEIFESQVGTLYDVIQHTPNLDVSTATIFSATPVIGTGGTVVLHTRPIFEDVDLRIRARNGEHTVVVEGILPLRVRANTQAPTQLSPIIDDGGAATVHLEQTESRFEYQLFTKPVKPLDFDVEGQHPILEVALKNRRLKLRAPKLSSQASMTELGFTPIGERVNGADGPLELPISEPISEDTFVVVEVTKSHEEGPMGTNSETLTSTTPLAPVRVVLVRPQPEAPLRLDVELKDGKTHGPVKVFRGQAGVLYELLLDDEVGTVVGLPKSDTPSSIDLTPVPVGTVLRVRARKVLSGVEVELTRRAEIRPAPTVSFNERRVGRQLIRRRRKLVREFIIHNRRVGERYLFMGRRNHPIVLLPGERGRLTASLSSDAVNYGLFTLVIVQPHEDELEVVKRLKLSYRL